MCYSSDYTHFFFFCQFNRAVGALGRTLRLRNPLFSGEQEARVLQSAKISFKTLRNMLVPVWLRISAEVLKAGGRGWTE